MLALVLVLALVVVVFVFIVVVAVATVVDFVVFEDNFATGRCRVRGWGREEDFVVGTSEEAFCLNFVLLLEQGKPHRQVYLLSHGKVVRRSTTGRNRGFGGQHVTSSPQRAVILVSIIYLTQGSPPRPGDMPNHIHQYDRFSSVVFVSGSRSCAYETNPFFLCKSWKVNREVGTMHGARTENDTKHTIIGFRNRSCRAHGSPRVCPTI